MSVYQRVQYSYLRNVLALEMHIHWRWSRTVVCEGVADAPAAPSPRVRLLTGVRSSCSHAGRWELTLHVRLQACFVRIVVHVPTQAHRVVLSGFTRLVAVLFHSENHLLERITRESRKSTAVIGMRNP